MEAATERSTTYLRPYMGNCSAPPGYTVSGPQALPWTTVHW